MSKDGTQIDLSRLKSGGIIREKGKDRFTVRLRVPGGRLAVDRLKRIATVAEKYGGEFVHLSVRQSLELVNVDLGDIDALVAELAEAGQRVATCGARLRVPTACGGCEYNPNGLVDTQRSAMEVDEQLFAIATGHHKFKVGFAGCPFDCPKSAINDVGFQGVVEPELIPDACVGCGLCARNCQDKAITMSGDKRPERECSRCTNCGDCIKVCPTGAWKARRKGYMVRIGGKWGRHPLVGTLYATFLPEESVVPFIAEVLSWYGEKAEGLGRVRLGDVILKEGAESLRARLQERFPDHVVAAAIPPQVIDTQVGSCRKVTPRPDPAGETDITNPAP